MDGDRWRRINDLFHQALEHGPDARDAFLDEACGGDRALREEVQSLLRAHAESSVIDQPALEADPGLLRRHEQGPGDLLDTPTATGMDDPLIGQSVGPYEVTGLLGRGGMGVVYRGFDPRLGRPVAIKALPPMFGGDAVLRERLRREAMSAAALSHPGIATVYALEEFERHLYLVYEYVPGVTLRNTLRARSGMLPIDEVVSIARAIAHALAAAHAGGVIHRDLKPENVMYLPDGRIKVVDFGLARILAGEDQTAGEPLTRPGAPPGTPGYVAPELLRGEPPDARVDQFSFGVLLYELLAGRHPFAGEDGRSTVASILEDDPAAITTTRPDCPSELARIATTCLAKAPDARYPTTDDLVAALDPEGSPSPVETPPPLATAPRPVTSDVPPAPSSARWWWQFHQVVVTTVYSLALYPMWRAREWVPDGWGLLTLMAAVAVVGAAANLRLHLWFTARIYPAQLADQRRRSAVWKRLADTAFALLLLVTAAVIAPTHPRWAALLIAVSISSLLSARVMEPATERAAFPSD